MARRTTQVTTDPPPRPTLASTGAPAFHLSRLGQRAEERLDYRKAPSRQFITVSTLHRRDVWAIAIAEPSALLTNNPLLWMGCDALAGTAALAST